MLHSGKAPEPAESATLWQGRVQWPSYIHRPTHPDLAHRGDPQARSILGFWARSGSPRTLSPPEMPAYRVRMYTISMANHAAACVASERPSGLTAAAHALARSTVRRTPGGSVAASGTLLLEAADTASSCVAPLPGRCFSLPIPEN
jgi:hypothetical protein